MRILRIAFGKLAEEFLYLYGPQISMMMSKCLATSSIVSFSLFKGISPATYLTKRRCYEEEGKC